MIRSRHCVDEMGKADISSKFTLGESFVGTSTGVPCRDTTTIVANWANCS